MGGALAILAAMYVPEFDAAVDFYGYPPAEAGDPGKIKIPFQGHWATRDDFFTIDGVDRIEARLQEAGAQYEFHRYEAEHGFHNPNELGNAGLGHYNETFAQLSWQRSVDFLKKHLR